MAGTRDQLDSMAPWDAAAYFQTIKEAFVSSAGGSPALLVTGDPNRVAILFAAGAGFNAWVSTNPNAVQGQGLSLGTSLPPVQLLFSEVGPLVQQAWYGVSSGPVSITVFTVSLSRWPQAEQRKVAPGVKRPTNAIQRNSDGR